MKDYLNNTEKNQYMVLKSILQLMQGDRRDVADGPKLGTMLEEWLNHQNMTKEEHKQLKTSMTYLGKFLDSVYHRLSPKEQAAIDKKLMKFDFRLIDDYTLKQITRDINDRFVNAVVPREQFYKWTEELMCVTCQGCTKDWNTCELHKVFEENFIPESGFNLPNCKFAYEKI